MGCHLELLGVTQPSNRYVFVLLGDYMEWYGDDIWNDGGIRDDVAIAYIYIYITYHTYMYEDP